MARSSKESVATPSSGSSSGGRTLRRAALIALALATGLSGWLAVQGAGSGSVPGCDAGDCAAVLASKWSKVFGVPVGLFGAATYVILAVLGARPFGPGQWRVRVAGAALAILIPTAAVWFGFLQAFVLRAFCPWCTATHAVATTGAILMALAWRREGRGAGTAGTTGRKGRRETAEAARGVWGPAFACAAVAMGGWMGVQALSPEPPPARIVTASMGTTSGGGTNAGPVADPSPGGESAAVPAPGVERGDAEAGSGGRTVAAGRLRLHQGRFDLDARELPLVGSPEAPYLAVMISDYSCRYCRNAHRTLHDVWEGLGTDRLGLFMLPSYGSAESREIQRMMLATWRVDRDLWRSVADDLYGERTTLHPTAVRSVLSQRLGADRLQAALVEHEGWITWLFELTREIHAANRAVTQRGNIPQFIIGQEIVVGAPADAQEFFRLFASHLGLVRERIPELRLGTEVVDLGRAFAGTQRPVTISFTNPGQAPLMVQRVSLPAGGRVLRGLRTPVPPGGAGLLDLMLVMPRDEGEFEETLTIHSDARVPSVPVRVTGRSWKPLTITPPILDLGRVDPQQSATQGVMRLSFAEDVGVVSVHPQTPGFTARLNEVLPGREYDVEVGTDRALGTGLQQTALFVQLQTPVPEGWPESLALAARVLVERAVTVVPPRVVVPGGMLATDRHHQVLVRCLDGMPDFAITGAVLEGGPVFTQPQVQRGGGTNSYVVQMTLPSGWSLPPAPLGARLVIETNHPKYPSIDVPLVAQGI
ncbi:MAG: DUF1573 domain-containing protein [Verrucomicrobiae bacterium]|nr:DUF1573 domain-containing protein [Verrucomicrobiae bacterium]